MENRTTGEQPWESLIASIPLRQRDEEKPEMLLDRDGRSAIHEVGNRNCRRGSNVHEEVSQNSEAAESGGHVGGV